LQELKGTDFSAGSALYSRQLHNSYTGITHRKKKRKAFFGVVQIEKMATKRKKYTAYFEEQRKPAIQKKRGALREDTSHLNTEQALIILM